MFMKKYNKGFTLLEMLVVIIIVSVLSIVGKLSYDISVEKAVASEMIPTITTIANAQFAYYNEHRKYANNIFDLGLDMVGEKMYNFHPYKLFQIHGREGDTFLGDGLAIRTKYFIYATGVYTEPINGKMESYPCVHAYRYSKLDKNGEPDYKKNYGGTFKFEDPTKPIEHRFIFSWNDGFYKVRTYVFRKVVLKQLLGKES